MANKNIQRIGIVGEGKMGSNIFYYLIKFNFSLTWISNPDTDPKRLESAFHKKVNRQFKNGLIDEDKLQFKLKNTFISNNLNDLSDCDIIIECIFENIEQKSNLFNKVDKIAQKDCIFATNSSSIKPSKLMPEGKRRDKFIGLHFFYPIEIKNIVELVITDFTSNNTLETIQGFLSAIDRKPLQLPEEGVSLLNRLFLEFQVGTYNFYEESSITIHTIDNIVKENLFPIGVFEFFDNVGIDVMLASVKNFTKDIDNKEIYQPLINKLQQLTIENKLGVKTKCGFYNYDIEDSFEKDNLNISVKSIVKKLQIIYIQSAFKFVKLGYISEQELDWAVREYMDIEEGPFVLAKKLGIK